MSLCLHPTVSGLTPPWSKRNVINGLRRLLALQLDHLTCMKNRLLKQGRLPHAPSKVEMLFDALIYLH
jgi:hypothetical protein